MRQNIRWLAVIALLLLTSCLPQLSGSNPLHVRVTAPDEAMVTFNTAQVATETILYLGRVQRVLSASQQVVCQPVKNLGTSCTVPAPITGVLTLTVQAQPNSVDEWTAVPLSVPAACNITASAWYTTPAGDEAGRATISLTEHPQCTPQPDGT